VENLVKKWWCLCLTYHLTCGIHI